MFQGRQLPQETAAGLDVDIAVVGSSGLVAETPNDPLSPSTLSGLARAVSQSGRSVWVDLYDNNRVHRRIYAAPVTLSDGGPLVLIASTPLSPSESSVNREIALIAVLSLLLLVPGGAFVYWLIGRVLRPVGRIASLAERLSERELHHRVEVRAPDDELGELVRTFNRMLDRLETSFEALRGFTADASHELRAPLALMYTARST
jgi:HAMP domain-containing protein